MKLARGFTILEFVIALAIIAIILVSVYASQGFSLSASTRLKNTQIATNLARTLLHESELKFENMKFEALPTTEETGNFTAPWDQFSWKRDFETLDFTALSEVFLAGIAQDKTAQVSSNDATVLKYFQDYMAKSIRKMTITVEWPEGQAKGNVSFTTLLVRYDADFATGL